MILLRRLPVLKILSLYHYLSFYQPNRSTQVAAHLEPGSTQGFFLLKEVKRSKYNVFDLEVKQKVKQRQIILPKFGFLSPVSQKFE